MYGEPLRFRGLSYDTPDAVLNEGGGERQQDQPPRFAGPDRTDPLGGEQDADANRGKRKLEE